MTDCLKKGVKIASQCMDPGTRLQLFVELLNKYLYFHEKGVASITEGVLQELLDKIGEELDAVAKDDEKAQLKRHYENTIAHIALKRADHGMYTNLTAK